MSDAIEAARRAILTRAATCEAARQTAHAARNWPAAAEAEAELRELYRAYADLERAA